MTELQQWFDRELWRWELSAGAGAGSGAGPAGVASVELAVGVTAHADGLDGRILRLDIDADDERGTLSVDAEEVLRSLGLDPPRDTTTIRLADGVAGLLARLAVLDAEHVRAEALGPASDAWVSEAAALRRELRLPGSPSGAAPLALDPVVLDRARQVLEELPSATGRVAVDGAVAVDPSWIAPGVLDLRRVHTVAAAGSMEVVVSSLVRDGIYAAAVTGISAALIEESTGIVVGLAPFGYELLDDRPAATARIMVGAGRPADSVALWLTSDPARQPSPQLLTARRATEFARRAAQAGRLGLDDEAERLLAESSGEWARIGRTYPAAQPVRSAPFAGEVEDLATTGELGT